MPFTRLVAVLALLTVAPLSARSPIPARDLGFPSEGVPGAVKAITDTALFAAAPLVTVPGSAEARYQQAERFLGWNAGPLVVGSASAPSWMEGGNRFWVRVSQEEGHEFLRVDPERGQVAPLFDNARMAAAMSMAGDTAFDPLKLPFTTFDLVKG